MQGSILGKEDLEWNSTNIEMASIDLYTHNRSMGSKRDENQLVMCKIVNSNKKNFWEYTFCISLKSETSGDFSLVSGLFF